MEATTRSPSYPFMDLDDLPDGLVGVDDMYLGNYLKGVEGTLLFDPSLSA